ncbi:hypothetical protein C8R46DRAFT_1205598 [Mycena filopes]|nr:hypothetical protein C8R46DRAFT_1205598 [Mycena filopes]
MPTFVDRTSGDGHSFVRQTVPILVPSPLKRARLGAATNEESTPSVSQPSETWCMVDRYDMLSNDDTDDPPLPTLPRVPNPKRYEPSDKTMNR